MTVEAGNHTPNAQKVYEVTAKDLPLHCPTPEMSLWNSHPRVYIPLAEKGKAVCPYCGAKYVLKGGMPKGHH
jgi:uncharacterized Zn-finger protein